MDTTTSPIDRTGLEVLPIEECLRLIDDAPGWSVLARGIAEAIWSREAEAELAGLGLEPWADAVERDRWVAIHPDQITGRRILTRPWEGRA